MKRPLIAITLIIVTMAASFAIPRPKYVPTNILKEVTLPLSAGTWTGQDVDQKLNLGEGLLSYIGDILMRKYVNDKGEVVYLIVMDAGNFHHPKLCFSGSGYNPKDMPDTNLDNGGNFNAPTVFFEKKQADTLVLYWLCIDKQRVNWSQQKSKEFFYSLIGKKRTGVIVRLDIPGPESRIKSSLAAAKDFVKTMRGQMSAHDAAFIFGN